MCRNLFSQCFCIAWLMLTCGRKGQQMHNAQSFNLRSSCNPSFDIACSRVSTCSVCKPKCIISEQINESLLSLCTWFSKGMNHHNGCWLDHVAMDTLQFFPSPLVYTRQLLVLPIGYPQPVLKYCKVKRSTWMNQNRGKEDLRLLSVSR